MQPNTVLAGRYHVYRLLGRGGMGEVWQGHDVELDRDVAVKLMRDSVEDPDSLRRFRREAALAAGLQHPAITVVHDAGRHEGRPFIVMELLPGQELASLIRAHPGGIPVIHAVDLGIQLADALAAAHEKAIVHRDLKPGNVIVLPGGRLKVCDFGFAKDLNAPSLTTRPGEVFGTSAYMAPEQWLGKPATASIDVYAFGCVLYEMLTGAMPFDGPTLPAFLHQHLSVAPVPARARNPRVPADLDDLIAGLLAKDPAGRPSAVGVLAALTAIRDRLRDPAGTAGATAAVAPIACAWGQNAFHVFDLDGAGRLWQRAMGPSGWTPRDEVRWEHLRVTDVAAVSTYPAPGQADAGTPALSIVSDRGAWASPEGSSWHSLSHPDETAQLSFPLTRAAVAKRQSGDGLTVYALDSAGRIWHRSWDGLDWTAWKETPSPVAGQVTAIAIDPTGGVLDVVATAEGRICYRSGLFQPVTTGIGRPVVDAAYSSAARLHSCVFVLDDAGTIWHLWDLLHQGGHKQSDWTVIPGPTRDVAGIASDKVGDGAGILLAATASGATFFAHYEVTATGLPQWSSWNQLP
jgi:hypothetical protein